MRKPTLLKKIIQYDLQIVSPDSLPTTVLRNLITDQFSTYLEDWFVRRIRRDLDFSSGLLLPSRNKCHIPGTNLEFDFSWRSRKLAVEIQGGIDSRTRRSGHVSPEGMRRDMRKMCLAQLEGWILLQLAPEQITSDYHWRVQTLPWIIKALNRGIQS